MVKQLVDGMPPTTPGIVIQYKLNSQYLIKNNFFGQWRNEDLRDEWQMRDYIQIKIPMKNQLPFQNNIYFDRLFQLLSPDDIVSIFTALLTEEKSILIVSRKKFDLMAV